MLFLVVISLLSSGVAAHFGSRNSSRYSGQNTTAATANDVINLVRQTLQNASSGIDRDDLVDDTFKVKIAAFSYLRANGSQRVPKADVRALIQEVAAERNVTLVEYNSRFHGVVLTAGSLADALTLWDALASRAQQLQDAGQSPRVAIAAIGKLSKTIRRIAYQTGNTSG